MFKTLTAAKIYLQQGLFKEALEILEELEKENNDPNITFHKIIAFEGLGLFKRAKDLCVILLEKNFATDEVKKILDRIKNKDDEKKSEKIIEYTEDEIAKVYEMLGDYDNAIFWYNKKIEKLKDLLKD
jgi:tetratricopeptide (TPR) repeat protein